MHDLHDLFLIDHDTVGLGGVAIHDLVDIGNSVLAVLAPVVVGDEVHRPRTEQGVGGDEILEAVGLHLHQQAAHAGGFKLEDAGGVAAAEHLEDFLVVEGQAVEIEGVGAAVAFLAADGGPDCVFRETLVDELLATLDHAGGAQAEEVHLQQAHLLAGGAVPLGDDVLGVGGFVERDDL